MNKTILTTQPEYDYTTRYISCWTEKIVRFARSRNFKVIILKGKRANRSEFESVIKKTTPRLLLLNGHGSEMAIAGQYGNIIVQVNLNESILKLTIVYALSCRSAKMLGTKSVESGTDAYIGYDEDFIFVYDDYKRTKPLEDKTAQLFLNPSNQIAITLLRGRSAFQAYRSSQKAYRKTIIKLLTNGAKNEKQSYLPYLLWNMNHQACLGNKDAII